MSRIFEYRTCERDLITATHVCRDLRSALISSSILWTRLRFRSDRDLDRTLTYLERSRSAPIDVSVDVDLWRDPEVLNYLVPHIARTRSLAVQNPDGSRTSILFCKPAPSLQHLEIRGSESFVYLPDNFLGQQVPSLRSVIFSGFFPTFKSPLPNLTEFSLHMSESPDPSRMSALFRFFSDCPLLSKIRITAPSSQIVQDISPNPNQTVSLESLVELEYATVNSSDQILPCLKLPRLERLRVTSSLEPGQMQKLTDILPYNGRAFLAGATEMFYYSVGAFQEDSLRVGLSGNGVSITFVACCIMDYPSVDWFSDQTPIPFGQIEDLKVEFDIIVTEFPISAFAFENPRVLRIAPRDVKFIEGFLGLLHPDPGAGVPCRSLREIECTFPTWWGFPEPLITLLKSVVMERKRAGHQLGLVRFWVAQGSDQDSVEDLMELREHVGEVRVGKRNQTPGRRFMIISGSTSMLNGLLPFTDDVHD